MESIFWLVLQVDDRAAAIEVLNSHEVVSSRKFVFVLNRCTWSEDVKTSKENRTARIHVTRSQGTKFHPKSLVQDNIDVRKVLARRGRTQ